MKKTAILVIAAILVFAPFHAEAAPPADFEKEIAALKTQIQLLEMRLAKIEAGEKHKSKAEIKKEKKLKTKKQKRMDEGATGAAQLPEAVIELDAKWAEREAELDAKYKSPGKWKLVDDKAVREFKKYQEKREALLSQ